MQKVGGVYLPDGERHLVEWMRAKNQTLHGVLTYQWDKQRTAYGLCAHTRVAVDVGGHCGLWSMNMITRFDQVIAFEPVREHRECFRMNVLPGDWIGDPDDPAGPQIAGPVVAGAVRERVLLYPWALGAEAGSVAIHTAPTSSGDSWVAGSGNIPMIALDTLELPVVDLIKIDCEGYELNVLRGAEQTILRCRPVIVVEQKPGHAQRFGFGETDAVPYLLGLGYRCVREMGGDFFLVPAGEPAVAAA